MSTLCKKEKGGSKVYDLYNREKKEKVGDGKIWTKYYYTILEFIRMGKKKKNKIFLCIILKKETQR